MKGEKAQEKQRSVMPLWTVFTTYLGLFLTLSDYKSFFYLKGMVLSLAQVFLLGRESPQA